MRWTDLRDKYKPNFDTLFLSLMAYGAGQKDKAIEVIKQRGLRGKTDSTLTEFRQDMETYFVEKKIDPTPEFCLNTFQNAKRNPDLLLSYKAVRKPKKSSTRRSIRPNTFTPLEPSMSKQKQNRRRKTTQKQKV